MTPAACRLLLTAFVLLCWGGEEMLMGHEFWAMGKKGPLKAVLNEYLITNSCEEAPKRLRTTAWDSAL
ncbi:hypothetical protein E2C01_064463 [Portunus trituberculatus]|uniref:Uncharacterized protein n=1 Tax=Portunus trituberculatus TaxID=210409 RepID=A0A5B7HBX2_PORTR|nr:hypothetical protein [Portunus trituberculatus]